MYLNCLIYGDKPAHDSIFGITVLPSDPIPFVKTKLWQLIDSPGCSASDLTLYTPLTSISIEDEDAFNRTLDELNLDASEGLTSVKKLKAGFTVSGSGLADHTSQDLHILVLVPRSIECNKRKRVPDDVVDRLLELWRSKRQKGELPRVEQLAQLVDSPLSENEKISISELLMGWLLSPGKLTDRCTMDDVRLLFRVSDDHTPLDEIFYALKKGPPSGGTEDSFHHFWDGNVRDMLDILFPGGKSIRNSNHHTATKSLRPDYAFLLNKLCPFRGQEKPEGSKEDPKTELVTKLAWAYDPAPYVLGYCAIGTDFTLVAITSPPQGQDLPVVHDIAFANLRFLKDRIKNTCRIIKLSSVFQSLSDVVRSPDAEFQVLERDHGTVEIAGHAVVKKYTEHDRYQRIDHLKKVYHLLHENKVPNVDELKTTSDSTAVLVPRGISQPPRTKTELLEALVVHQIPLFHRDIRWPNVVRRLDNPKMWFVIDWDYASTPPTAAQRHFNHTTHSPSVFSDRHGAEVDVWGVGELILQSEAMGVSSELRALGQQMKDSVITAQEALRRIRVMSETRITQQSVRGADR